MAYDDDRLIRQNGPKLVKISETIESKIAEIAKSVDELYTEIDSSMGTEEEQNKIWYGRRAHGCRTLANKHKPTFEKMNTAGKQLATKVHDDATTWGAEDSGKYA